MKPVNIIVNEIRIILLLIISVFSGCKKHVAQDPSSGTVSSFRTVGYLMIDRDDLLQAVTAIDFSKITHLNLAFINPDANGVFPDNAALKPLIALAHAHQDSVFMSIGGGDGPSWISGLLADNKRPAFVDAIFAFVAKYSLDGVDVDLEGNSIDNNYGAFISDLSKALDPGKKTLSAAVGTWEGPTIPDSALSLFDFINIMSYDNTGPWDPSNPGPHAPYSMAVSDLAYWGNTRGVPKEKMNLGLPFYGYGFGPNNMTSTMIYSEIVSAYPGAENKDQISLSNGETMYYNGIPTIKSKTSLALNEAGGVMIWELLQDSQGATSLLNAINKTIKSK